MSTLKKYQMNKYGIVIYICASLLVSETIQLVPEESLLLTKLLVNHSKDIRPLPKSLHGPTLVNIVLKFIQAIEMDERNEILSLLTWTSMEWEDSTFTWDPGAHSNINSLLFPAENIWIPDVMLHNTQDIATGFHLGLPQKDEDLQFMADAKANGSIKLSFPHIFKSNCKLNISEYPFDTQHCPLIFGSWSHDESEVIINIKVERSPLYSIDNKAWQFIGNTCTKKPSRCAFQGSGENCRIVECNIVLKRRAWFEVISYTLPTIIIAALSLMVFMVPPEVGKRMEVGITLILCVAVYLSLINKKMPPTSESFPLVSQFYGCIIVEITVAMVCSCYCLHIYDPEGLRLLHFPSYLRTLAFGVLARLTFYQTKGGKPSRVHPTNAELKIAEKRRKSMITVNSSIHLSQNSSMSKHRGAKASGSGQCRMQMENIAECPEGQEIQKEEEPNETKANNSNQNEREEVTERVEELPLEEVEEENIEEEIIAADPAVNENQILGEIRCDSGFGEPGGSLSIRSSLLSSDSVPLPVDENSPPPQCEANCDCGQPNCNGQGVIVNNNHGQLESANGNTSIADGKEKVVQFGGMSRRQSGNQDQVYFRRAQTVFLGEMKSTNMSNGPLSKTLSARPYTDSVLETWTRRKNIKKMQTSIRSKAGLRFENEGELEDEGGSQQQRKLSTAGNSSRIVERHENDIEAGECLVNGSNSQKPADNASRQGSTLEIQPNSKINNSIDPSVQQGNSDVAAERVSLNGKESDGRISNGIRAEPRVGSSTTANPVLKQRHSEDEIELVDINEEECLESIVDVRKGTLVPALTEESRDEDSRAAGDRSAGDRSAGDRSAGDRSAGVADDGGKNNVLETFAGSDTETDGDVTESENNNADKIESEGGKLEKTLNINDPKVLFARRHWDTLRDRIERRITVKEVFGQILSPKETSPIVAIANVLLRDQRKYVMRTEWMTSAIIFNRFFTILLALAVFISLLAVFMQSSRLSSFFKA